MSNLTITATLEDFVIIDEGNSQYSTETSSVYLKCVGKDEDTNTVTIEFVIQDFDDRIPLYTYTFLPQLDLSIQFDVFILTIDKETGYCYLYDGNDTYKAKIEGDRATIA